MGLSDEERLQKTYGMLREWRQRLVALVDALDADHADGRAIARGWITATDRLVGGLIAQRDASSGYWIMGSRELNYASLYSNPYGLAGNARGNRFTDADDAESESYPYVTHERSFEWWAQLSTPAFLARAGIAASNERTIAAALAAWWHAWACVDPLLYPVFRYPDKLFPRRFHARLERLLGDVAGRRYEACVPSFMSGGDHESIGARLEQALLAKHALFDAFIASLRDEVSGGLQGKAYVQKCFRDPWPAGEEVCTMVGRMSALEVEAALAQIDAENRRKQSAAMQKVDAADRAKRPAPGSLFGEAPPTREDLQQRLKVAVEHTQSEVAYERTREALRIGYGDYDAPAWKQRPKPSTHAPCAEQPLGAAERCVLGARGAATKTKRPRAATRAPKTSTRKRAKR